MTSQAATFQSGIEHHLKGLESPMKQWKKSGHFPPVLLLTGPSGIGKREFGLFLAKWFLCKNVASSDSPIDLKPCENCESCLRWEQAIDFLEVKAEDSDSDSPNSALLKIDQFRKLKEKMGFGAEDHISKVILIPKADRMTTQAANSILKLLEEPPPGWVFILTCHDPHLLLPTLVSRCVSLKLKPFLLEQIEALLSAAQIKQDRIQICASLSQGSLKRAFSLASDEIWEQRKLTARFIADPGKNLQPLMDWASSEPGNLEPLLDLLEQNTQELILATQVPEWTWTQQDLKSEFLEHFQKALSLLGTLEAREFWSTRCFHLNEIRQRATTPVNRKILIQDLLLPWFSLGSKATDTKKPNQSSSRYLGSGGQT